MLRAQRHQESERREDADREETQGGRQRTDRKGSSTYRELRRLRDDPGEAHEDRQEGDRSPRRTLVVEDRSGAGSASHPPEAAPGALRVGLPTRGMQQSASGEAGARARNKHEGAPTWCASALLRGSRVAPQVPQSGDAQRAPQVECEPHLPRLERAARSTTLNTLLSIRGEKEERDDVFPVSPCLNEGTDSPRARLWTAQPPESQAPAICGGLIYFYNNKKRLHV